MTTTGMLYVVGVASVQNGIWSAEVPITAVNGTTTNFRVKAKHQNNNGSCLKIIDVSFIYQPSAPVVTTCNATLVSPIPAQVQVNSGSFAITCS